MKKILFALIAVFGLYTAQAQVPAAKPWKELQAFHSLLAMTFHPAEEGNYKPLKDKTSEMYTAAKNLQGSQIPAAYKLEQTRTELTNLLQSVFDIQTALIKNAPDSELFQLIEATHEIFHKITGECKKEAD